MSHALKIIESLATVVIAGYVASVGTFQWITARDSVRLNLYDRRFEVYARTMDFMQALMEWSSVPDDQKRSKRIAFIRAVRESRFLFADDPAILSLMEEINVRSFKVTGFVDELSKWALIMPKEYVAAYEDKQASLEWIMVSVGPLESKLHPYLAFRHREMRQSKWH